MRYRYSLLLILLPLFLLLSTVSSQSNWDLGIDRVNLVSTSVKQGELLKMAIYVKNNEGKPFFGIINVTIRIDESKIPALMEFICIGNEANCPSPSVPGFGVKELPANGYVSLTFNLDTSRVEAGAHKLTIEVRPRGYVDPNPVDNKRTVSFTVESTIVSYSMLTPLIAALVLLLLIALLVLRRRSHR